MRQYPTSPKPISAPASQDTCSPNRFYLQLGSQAQTLLAEADLSQIRRASNRSQEFTGCLALITLLQYLEGYTDLQAAEAVQSRAEWKYALQLPLVSLAFDPA